jgi:hypothetical protein
VLLAWEEMTLQGISERVTEIGICYGMEMNVEKISDENLKETIPNTDYDRSRSTRACKLFQIHL